MSNILNKMGHTIHKIINVKEHLCGIIMSNLLNNRIYYKLKRTNYKY